jgi:hypothetical protein
MAMLIAVLFKKNLKINSNTWTSVQKQVLEQSKVLFFIFERDVKLSLIFSVIEKWLHLNLLLRVNVKQKKISRKPGLKL